MGKSVLWAWAGIAASVAACSGTTTSNGNAGGGSATVDQACTKLVSTVCDKLAMCVPLGIQVAYGDVATCKMRVNLSCPSLVGGTGSTAKPGDVDACSQIYATASCSDLVGNGTPVGCDFHGTLTAGAACANSSQCAGANGYCNMTGAGQTGCGVCGTRAAAGASCSSTSDCQLGLKCGLGTGAAMGACVTPAAAGAACDDPHPCSGSLACVSGTCSQPLGAGVACSSTSPSCDGTQGLYCDPTTSVCTAEKTASAGGACGISIVDRTITACTGGSTCKSAAGSLSGTCQAPAADGAACDSTAGPPCLSPAVCTNGVCKIRDPAACK